MRCCVVVCGVVWCGETWCGVRVGCVVCAQWALDGRLDVWMEKGCDVYLFDLFASAAQQS